MVVHWPKGIKAKNEIRTQFSHVIDVAPTILQAAKLIVELDGAQHLELGQAKYDAQRTRDLEQQGLKVLRFDDRQALLQTESVREAIFQAVKNPS
jgi:very-short-patch-repair endonuclease